MLFLYTFENLGKFKKKKMTYNRKDFHGVKEQAANYFRFLKKMPTWQIRSFFREFN